MILPSRDLERGLLTHHEAVAGIDEVGRGALAGPVCVGAAVVTRATAEEIPAGLRDSKLISAGARPRIAVAAGAWVAASAIGSASPQEIDAIGIVAALRLAASRAFAHLSATGQLPTAAILDGTHNWLEPNELFPEVVLLPKADARCAVVAAASILAKVHRDRLMEDLEDPGYGFAAHKGYGAATHLAAIRELGPGAHHRRSWKLPEQGAAG